MNKARALMVGAFAGLVLSLLMALGRLIGIPVNLEMLWGTLFGFEPGLGVWLLGLGIHLIISGLAGLLYGLGFEHMTQKATWRIGMLFAVCHVLFAGLLLGLAGPIHPLMPEVLEPPGAFFSHYGGIPMLGFIIGHLIFGAIVGRVYGPVSQPQESGVSPGPGP